MSDIAATEPVVDAPEPAPTPEVAPETPEVGSADGTEAEGQEPTPEVEAAELDGTEVQPEPEPPAPETWEVEKNGRKYAVPIELKDEVMWHQDYTSKTQELAQERRSLESELSEGRKSLESDRVALNQVNQAQQENIQDWGEFAHTEKMLAEYRDMTQAQWNQIRQDDPEQFDNLRVNRDMLRDTRDVLGRKIKNFETAKRQREHDTKVSAERESADHRNRFTATLAREIPNYSPELQTKMNETALRYGVKQETLDKLTDSGLGNLLYLAHLGDELQQRKRAATAAPAPTPVKPTPKVTGGSSPKPGVHDGLPIDEWMRRERQRQDKLATG